MQLSFRGSTSINGSCPNLYATDRGTYVVQGYKVDAPDAVATLHQRGMPDYETAVEIPAALLSFAPKSTTRLVRGAEFNQLFTSFTHSAWRWECQTEYREPHEATAFRQFLAGEEPDMSFTTEWLANVRRATTEGRQFQRVRALTDPLTDYLRFEMAAAPANAEAGEDIRVLTADDTRRLGLPEHDFWLFDDAVVAIMHFDEQGMIAAELVEDEDVVARHRKWRDIAWENAAPFETALT